MDSGETAAFHAQVGAHCQQLITANGSGTRFDIEFGGFLTNHLSHGLLALDGPQRRQLSGRAAAAVAAVAAAATRGPAAVGRNNGSSSSSSRSYFPAAKQHLELVS